MSSLRPSDHPVLLSSLLFPCNSFGATTKWTSGSFDGANPIWPSRGVPSTPMLAYTVPLVHLTVTFLSLSFLVFDP
jgi:hypothetical protein